MEMIQSLEELEKEKENLQKRADELRKKRDELNKKSKELTEERDELSARIRELRVKIREHKMKRDELNQRVKSAKEKRAELNRLYQRAKRKLRELERRKSLSLGVNIEKLKKQLRRLENEQMTQPMSPQKEKEIVEKISKLHAKLKECEEKISRDIRLKRAYEELNRAKERAERQHAEVEELAEKAQKEHEEMLRLIEECDAISKRIEDIQEKIVFTKIEADNAHRQFIECVDKIHRLERRILSLKRSGKRKEDITIKKEASEIFERFKRGEKLSTEDILLLQKAGFI
ncbi:MAG: hypothetical protein FE042_03015 [Thermoplasmata archaeon]|nr:MAG: hypothetical protein FE042_03015 [Thermoplasmata archaeon]